MIPYNPQDWYWLADDGRLYGSARQALVSGSDAAYEAWLAGGGVATPWPRDEAGTQTDADLQEVLTPYGLWTSLAVALAAYANQKQWALATGGFTITLSGQVRTFATSEISMTLMNGKFLRLTQANPPAAISWQFATGFEDVAMADFVKAAVTVSDFVQATFDALKPVLAAIAAGTITTTAQIDAAAWPSAVASG